MCCRRHSPAPCLLWANRTTRSARGNGSCSQSSAGSFTHTRKTWRRTSAELWEDFQQSEFIYLLIHTLTRLFSHFSRRGIQWNSEALRFCRCQHCRCLSVLLSEEKYLIHFNSIYLKRLALTHKFELSLQIITVLLLSLWWLISKPPVSVNDMYVYIYTHNHFFLIAWY